jgi:hypothetical protein
MLNVLYFYFKLNIVSVRILIFTVPANATLGGNKLITTKLIQYKNFFLNFNSIIFIPSFITLWQYHLKLRFILFFPA